MKTNKKYMISEELLAAFIEGKTNKDETTLVLEALANNEDLQEEYIMSKRLDAMMGECDESVDYLPVLQMAAESENNLCDFLCEQYILNERGLEFDAQKLSEEAHSNCWLKEKGTPLHCVGRLLEQHDLIVMRRFGAETADIIRSINAHHDVIVIVNNNKLTGKICDEISYHAVVVIQITAEGVVLYDPAVREEQVHYKFVDFESAWKDAKSYLVRVKGKDFDYNPRPIDLDDVELSSELIDLREAIAENAHEVWADQRQEEGWTYGIQRDDAKKKHPDLVPYSMLSDSEKEYDRRMAFDSIKLMRKMGFEIIKHENTALHASLMYKIKNQDLARKCECGSYIFLDQLYCSHCGKKLDWKLFK